MLGALFMITVIIFARKEHFPGRDPKSDKEDSIGDRL